MARKKIARIVQAYPRSQRFLPTGDFHKIEINVMIEEVEAMRLMDLMELSQQEAADQMGVSRQTFQNILECGRKKVTKALFRGYGIVIKGGNHSMLACEMQCNSCNEVYAIAYIDDKKICPKCGGSDLSCHKERKCCNGWCDEHQ